MVRHRVACRPPERQKLQPDVRLRAPLVEIAGTTPLVLVAPHGGRRDPVERPWGKSALKVNDLHTAALTVELAERTGAAALINDGTDRNDVDLNRISGAVEHAPDFLVRLAGILDATVGRFGHATLLTIHGWNVIQPAVDVGLGCTPGDDPFVVGPTAAVSPGFAASAVRALADACAARDIVATIGARYPAKAKENLLQLFTQRYRSDPRDLVRALATFADRVDAVQLELGIPLRWAGPWRARLLDACIEVTPRLTGEPRAARAAAAPVAPVTPAAPTWRTLQFVSERLSGLVAVDAAGGRLLLFPPKGGVLLFTGERVVPQASDHVGALALERPDANVRVRYAGPLLDFDETTPFLDLEHGLGTARLIDGSVALTLTPCHPNVDATGDFGRISGTVTLGSETFSIDGWGFAEDGPPSGPWPRLRASLKLPDRGSLTFTTTPDGGAASGFLCADGHHTPVVSTQVHREGPRPLDPLRVDVDLEDGSRIEVSGAAVHQLPVVRSRGEVAVRLLFAACRLDGRPEPAGWCEVVLSP